MEVNSQLHTQGQEAGWAQYSYDDDDDDDDIIFISIIIITAIATNYIQNGIQYLR
jgi:hypothetical protein